MSFGCCVAKMATPRTSTEYYKRLFASHKPQSTAALTFLRAIDSKESQRIWAGLWKEMKKKGSEQSDAMEMLRGKLIPDEDYLQPLFTAVHRYCMASLLTQPTALVVRDTSTRLAPLSPLHKFDHCWVPAGCASAGDTVRVEWPYVVHIEQIKAIAADGTSDKWGAGLLQLAQDFEQILLQQPQRHRVTGHITSGTSIQLWWCDESPDRLFSSPKLDFLLPDRTEPTDGFELYLRMMAAAPSELGHTANVLPSIPPDLYTVMKWKRSKLKLSAAAAACFTVALILFVGCCCCCSVLRVS